MLQYGSFESGLEHWLSCSDNGSSELVGDASDGSQALKITGGDCLYQEFAIVPGTDYVISCEGMRAPPYTSATLSIMDSSYTSLTATDVEITSSSYSPHTAAATAPNNGAICAVTFFSDGDGHFDACTVVAQTETPHRRHQNPRLY